MTSTSTGAPFTHANEVLQCDSRGFWIWSGKRDTQRRKMRRERRRSIYKRTRFLEGSGGPGWGRDVAVDFGLMIWRPLERRGVWSWILNFWSDGRDEIPGVVVHQQLDDRMMTGCGGGIRSRSWGPRCFCSSCRPTSRQEAFQYGHAFIIDDFFRKNIFV